MGGAGDVGVVGIAVAVVVVGDGIVVDYADCGGCVDCYCCDGVGFDSDSADFDYERVCGFEAS